MNFHTALKIKTFRKSFLADGTRIRTFTRVNFHVALKSSMLRKTSLANRTTMRMFTRVGFHMAYQMTSKQKRFLANLATMETFTNMDSHVALQSSMLSGKMDKILTFISVGFSCGIHDYVEAKKLVRKLYIRKDIHRCEVA